jgi:hypothetical protein
MFKKALTLLLCGSLATAGCASGGRTRVESPSFGPNDRAAIADYVQKLPAGSKVKVERADGESVKGTLMKTSDTLLVVQRNTRIAEPPIDIPLDQVTRVTVDSGTGTGKAVGIGVAVGVGAFFAVGLILAAIFGGG